MRPAGQGKTIPNIKKGVDKQRLILLEVFDFNWTDKIASTEEIKARATMLLRGQFEAWPKLEKLTAGQRLAGIIEGLKLCGKMDGAFQEPSKNKRDEIEERKTIKKAALAIWRAGHDNPNVPNPTPDEVVAVLSTLELAGWNEYAPELKGDLERMAASRDREAATRDSYGRRPMVEELIKDRESRERGSVVDELTMDGNGPPDNR